MKMTTSLAVALENIVIKNYDNWNTYDDITKYNIFVTYAVGMSIIMKASFAKKVFTIFKIHRS